MLRRGWTDPGKCFRGFVRSRRCLGGVGRILEMLWRGLAYPRYSIDGFLDPGDASTGFIRSWRLFGGVGRFLVNTSAGCVGSCPVRDAFLLFISLGYRIPNALIIFRTC